MENSEWLEIENLEDDVYPITEYDLVSTPNDFNGNHLMNRTFRYRKNLLEYL